MTKTRNFTYDKLQRLIAGGTTSSPETYSYDAQGNRTASHLSAAHVSDAANRLTEDGSFTYVYDLNGNLESKTDKRDKTAKSIDLITKIGLGVLKGGVVGCVNVVLKGPAAFTAKGMFNTRVKGFLFGFF